MGKEGRQSRLKRTSQPDTRGTRLHLDKAFVGWARWWRDFQIKCLFKNRVVIRFCNPTPGHISRQNYNLKRYMHSNVHSSARAIYNSQGMETT